MAVIVCHTNALGLRQLFTISTRHWVLFMSGLPLPFEAENLSLLSLTLSSKWRERERENSNSKTLFYKDCRLGSVKTCQQLVLAKLLMTNERERERG